MREEIAAFSQGTTVSSATSTGITELLRRWSNGDAAALEALLPIVYGELRRVARGCFASERTSHTLQSTARDLL